MEFSIIIDCIIVFASIIMLWKGADWLVDSAAEIAHTLKISDLVVGLTVVAFGTSAPEFAVTISAAVTKQTDISIGNVIGSNIFNLLAVMPIPGLIDSINLGKTFLYRDFSTMVFLTILVAGSIYFMRFGSSTANKIVILGRKMGVLLVTTYVLYYYWLYSYMWTG